MSEAEPLSTRQLALLEGLQDAERGGLPVDLTALATRSGYTESSIRTYFTKRLEGVLVFRDGDGWRVRGAVRCTSEDFAKRMSQKAGAASDVLRSEESWRAVLRKLLYEGQRRHYTLSREEIDLVGQLAPPPPRARIEEDLFPGQPSLFRK